MVDRGENGMKIPEVEKLFSNFAAMILPHTWVQGSGLSLPKGKVYKRQQLSSAVKDERTQWTQPMTSSHNYSLYMSKA